MDPAAAPLVAAIDLRKPVVSQAGSVNIRGRHLLPSELLTGAQVVAQVEDVSRRGGHAILLKIDSKGGDLGAAMMVYEALRAFSDGGGVVVAFIAGEATSSASLFALAADLIVMAPTARYLLHGAVPLDQEHDGQEIEAIGYGNRWVREVYEARARVVPEVLAAMLATSRHDHVNGAGLRMVQLLAPEAVHLGWADAIGDEDAALSIVGVATRARLRCARADAPAGAPGAVSGVGMCGVAEDGVTIVDLFGGTSTTSQFTITANNAAAAGWVEVNGYVKGRGASVGTALGTLVAPGQFHPSVRYVRLMVAFNSANGNGTQDLDSLEISEVASNVAVAPANMVLGSVPLDRAWFTGQGSAAIMDLTHNGSTWTYGRQVNLNGLSWNSGTKTLTVTFDLHGATSMPGVFIRNGSSTSRLKYVPYVTSRSASADQMTISFQVLQETAFGTYSAAVDWPTVANLYFDVLAVGGVSW